MATGRVSPCSSMASVDHHFHELGGDDVKVVYEAVCPIAAKYLFFGIQIGLKMNEIANIEMQCSTDPKKILLHVLSVRLKQSPALTWGDIETALRSKALGEHEQANRIMEGYGHLYYRLDPSLQATSDQQHGATEKNKRVARSHDFCTKVSDERTDNVTGEVSETKSHTNPLRVQGENNSETMAEQETEKSSKGLSSADPDKAETCGSSKFNESGEHNIFEHFFGRLCYEISNPVKIAAELQMKDLISKAVMKDMIMSPESQQAKTISLVDAVDETIKSKPELLFVFIEVLLEDEGLQTVGKEILRETGIRYPDRTNARFPNVPRPCDTMAPTTHVRGRTRDRQEKMASTGGKIEPEISPPLIGGIISPSRQSVPQSGLSQVLAKYKSYLQSIYNARAIAPADKYLPTLDAPYINLAMIMRGDYDTELRDEFTRRTLHGGVDQILQSKVPIEIEDLLTPDWKDNYLLIETYLKALIPKPGMFQRDIMPVLSARLGAFILVEGPPGIGKSTLAWEACRRWDEIENFRQYHTVLLLKLREKWVLNATSLSDLFRYPVQPSLSNYIAQELHDYNGRNLLLVLDGFDEVSHSFHEDSVIKSILCRQLLPECTIILTTRPVAKSALRSICQPQVDKHVEIIGFTEGERVRYITEVFSNKPELQANFLKYMFLVPHIKSMMYIPLNCAIVAQVYYESQSSRHLAIPRTRTQLYKALTHSLLVRHMRMKEPNHEYTSMLPEGLNKEEKSKFEVLTRFAFLTYHQGGLKQVTFFKEDIPEGFVSFGFMNESTEMYAGKGVERTLSFLHLSLQEYLPAWHLADTFSIEFQVAYHRLVVDEWARSPYKGSNKHEEALISSLEQQKSSLVEPAIFLAGITGWKSKSAGDSHHWESYLSHDTAHIEDSSVLFCSLYEAQNPTILSHYFPSYPTDFKSNTQSRRTLRIYSKLTPYNCYALSYSLAYSSVKLNLCVDLQEGDTSLLETFVKGLDDHRKSATPSVNKTVEVRCLYWLVKGNRELEDIRQTEYFARNHLDDLLQKLDTIQFLYISTTCVPTTTCIPTTTITCMLTVQQPTARCEPTGI